MANSVETEYLTPKEAAERKGVAVASIYKAIERGQIPSVRVLGRVALRVSDVEAYQPGSYGDKKREFRERGPGRPRTIGDGGAESPEAPEAA